MHKRINVKISGRVQMVMFRDFTTRTARRLALVGEVWNETDGTVCIIVEGEEAALRMFLSKLAQGSLLSRVDGVVDTWEEANGNFTKFSIRYT